MEMPSLEDCLSRGRLWTEVTLWRHGRLWAVTAVLTALAGALHLAADYWSQQERQQLLQAQIAQVPARMNTANRAPASQVPASSASSQDRLNAEVQPLWSTLPDRDQLGRQVRQLFALAGRQGVVLPQSYFQTEDTKGPVWRVQVHVPVGSDYRQLKSYMTTALLAMPNLSVDKLVLSRAQAKDPVGTVQVHFSLWYRAAAPESALAMPSTGERLR